MSVGKGSKHCQIWQVGGREVKVEGGQVTTQPVSGLQMAERALFRRSHSW